MKQLLIGLTMLSVFGACKQKTNLETDRDRVMLTDQSGNYTYDGYSDTASYDKQVISSGIFGVGTGYASYDAEPEVAAPVRTTTKSSGTTARRTSTARSTSGSSGSGSTASTGTTAPAKKGWSKAAKGAAIGGGVGAVGGAIIGRNAKGAIIGAVIGAGGGYVIGRSKDKKDGRY